MRNRGQGVIRHRLALHRRELLAGLGAAGALPFLPRRILAQEGRPKKRFLVFHSPNEPIDKAHWRPDGSGSSFGLRPGSLTSVMSSLERHLDDLYILGDMTMETRRRDNFGGGHVGIGHMLTGEINVPYGAQSSDFWAGGISVDQFLARREGVEAFTIGVQTRGSNGNNRISYRDRTEPVHPIETPTAAFNSIFGDFSVPEGDRNDLFAQRRSVLDVVAGRLSRLQSHYGADAARRLDRHHTAVREMEQSLMATPELACDPSAPDDTGDLPAKASAQMGVIVEALACGVTTVASLQLGGSGGAENFNGGLRWPSVGIDFPGSQHVTAHDYNSRERRNATTIERRERLETVYYDLFAELLDRLAAVIEPDGSRLLDNTLVLYTKPIGWNHSGSELLYMLGGRAGGDLRTGRYREFRDVPHNDLLAACCQLMGYSDVTHFGDRDIATGAISL
ncbi:MAG: DUF1552 domain-containing protein [Myxococcota bacterium]